ncbi:MAG: flagellar FlbD family protein [Candidatus Eisenbacteria bacterium]|nr:flagellar FlbD family protein [Candidatus Eisenbacteria bacterium]
MIHLTKLNGVDCVLNADLIETLESTPDTTITLISGHKMNVLEPVDEVVARVIEFRRRLMAAPYVVEGSWQEEEESGREEVDEAQDAPLAQAGPIPGPWATAPRSGEER